MRFCWLYYWYKEVEDFSYNSKVKAQVDWTEAHCGTDHEIMCKFQMKMKKMKPSSFHDMISIHLQREYHNLVWSPNSHWLITGDPVEWNKKSWVWKLLVIYTIKIVFQKHTFYSINSTLNQRFTQLNRWINSFFSDELIVTCSIFKEAYCVINVMHKWKMHFVLITKESHCS